MTIKKNGGIFGRNPTFNRVTVEGELIVDGSFVVNGASMAPIYRGTWNAATNDPPLLSGEGTQGDFYIISAGGSTLLDGVDTWGIGDWVLFNGTTWQRVEGGAEGDFGNILVSGNTISITELDGNLNLSPNGTGEIVSTKNLNIPTTNLNKLTWNVPATPFNDPTIGEMQWNLDEGTFEVGLNDSGTTLQVGQETLYRAKNQTGVAIPDGTLVTAVGTLGNSGVILIAPWTGAEKVQTIMGLATGNIPDGQDGYVAHFGKVRGIDATGSLYSEVWADGDILYAAPSGGLTNTEPQAPNTKTIVALVIHAVANGTLFVRPTFSSRLQDDDNVELTSPADGDVIRYVSANQRFENSALGSVATQDSSAVSITGGSIDGTTIGSSVPSTGVFTSITGTAVTQTNVDTTVNRLVKVGDYGIGNTAGTALWGDNNLPNPAGTDTDETISGAWSFTSPVSISSLSSDLRFTGSRTVSSNTADGSDSDSITLAGGGAASATRGGFVTVRGNEAVTGGGNVVVSSGITPSGEVLLATNNTTRARVKNSGAFNFEPLVSPPSPHSAGDMYYNASDNKLAYSNGTTFSVVPRTNGVETISGNWVFSGNPSFTGFISGNVGIGATPQDRLDLGNGALRFKASLGTIGTYGQIRAYNTIDATNPATNIRFIRDVDEAGNDGAICFDTKDSERLRIDSNGDTIATGLLRGERVNSGSGTQSNASTGTPYEMFQTGALAINAVEIYLVFGAIRTAATSYTMMALITKNDQIRIDTIAANNMAVSVDGTSVRIQQNSGVSQNLFWSWVRVM